MYIILTFFLDVNPGLVTIKQENKMRIFHSDAEDST